MRQWASAPGAERRLCIHGLCSSSYLVSWGRYITQDQRSHHKGQSTGKLDNVQVMMTAIQEDRDGVGETWEKEGGAGEKEREKEKEYEVCL